MVMASVMSKIGPFYSFSRWLLTSSGLVRYMHPSDEELRIMANVPKDKGKKGKEQHVQDIGKMFQSTCSLV